MDMFFCPKGLKAKILQSNIHTPYPYRGFSMKRNHDPSEKCQNRLLWQDRYKMSLEQLIIHKVKKNLKK